MDTSLLESLGLTHGEIKTYLALLKIGKSSTGPLAEESDVSRSKLYGILDRLEKKGLVSHVDESGVTRFLAAEPSRVLDIIKQKEEKLKRLERDFELFLPKLEVLYNEKQVENRVSVYQGLKGLQTAHEHTYQKLKKGDVYYYLGIPKDQPAPHHLYWQRDHTRRMEAGISCKLLFNYDVTDTVISNRASYAGCEVRRMSQKINTPAYFLIYADTVVLTVPSQHPIVIEIISQEIADAFIEYFKSFWQSAK